MGDTDEEAGLQFKLRLEGLDMLCHQPKLQPFKCRVGQLRP